MHRSVLAFRGRMAVSESRERLYQVLLGRCLTLEARQSELKEQLHELMQDSSSTAELPALTSASCGVTFDSGWGVDCRLLWDAPYRSLFDGHAAYVCSASSGEIICWNLAAESLYGWKAKQVVTQETDELLVATEYCMALRAITESVRRAGSWTGQFPFRKRSGEIFMAIVTKSAWYENGELVGIITVSNDAAVFNSSVNLHSPILSQGRGRMLGSNIRKNTPPRPQTAAVPQIASSVSNLASRLESRRRHGDDHLPHGGATPRIRDETAMEAEDWRTEKPARILSPCSI